MEQIETRDFTHAFNMPVSDEKREAFVRSICVPYKLIMVSGFSGTGKSTFLRYLKPDKNMTLSLWSRDIVMDSLFPDRNRIDKFYNYLSGLENKIIPELLDQLYRQVAVEGWYRTKRERGRYVTWAQAAKAKSAILVFDGPVDRIIQRCARSQRFMLKGRDLEFFIEQKMQTHVWPTHDEGFNDIIYINTFGKEGEEWLADRLR